MDSLDKVILVLPLLAVLDVVSTFYAQSLVQPLSDHAQGFLAGILVNADLLHAYMYTVVYLLIIVGMTLVLWYIKNQKLSRYGKASKVILLIIVAATCSTYAFLTDTFLVNFFLSSIISRGIDLFWLAIIIYSSSFLSLIYYTWHDVFVWVTARDRGRE